MRSVRFRLQRHVFAPGVEEPDEGGIVLEGIGRGQRGGLMVAPESAGTAERGQARGRRQPGSAKRQDSVAGVDELAELGDRGSRCHRFAAVSVFRMPCPERSAGADAAYAVETGDRPKARP